MSPDLTSDERAFQSEVRELFADYADLDGYFQQGRVWPQVKQLFRALGERGWLALGWPVEHGGLARSAVYEYLLWDEAAYARAARNPLSAGVVARSILRSGTPEQKARWLPQIRSGEIHFSLGYSEPEAGSDLASLRTRAERRGERYVVHGEKCWQSYAQDADYLWLLCRTGAPDSRSEGLSLLIVDLTAPGVSVRPPPTLDGEQLNQVYLDGVEVPLDSRIGPENGAWKLMAEALADERHIQFPAGRLRRDLADVVEWLRRTDLGRDADIRRRVAELAVGVKEAEMLALRVLDAALKGRSATVEAAANKVFHTVLCQKIARALIDFGGPEALLHGGRPETLWLQSLWETIGGGTSEVMRGIVAQHGLGLTGRR